MRVPSASLPGPEDPNRIGAFSWREYGRYILTGLFFIGVFQIVDSLIDRIPTIQRMERANLDALFSARTPKPSDKVFIIDVTEDDYDELFGGISPLQPAKVNEIIQAIVESGPKVLGVDFDTSGWKGVATPNPLGIPIIWARAAEGQPGNMTLADVLGGSPDVCYGVPAYLPNDDGVVRQYSEYVQGAGQWFPSLPASLAAVYLGGGCLKLKPAKEWKQPDSPPLINYAGDNRAFNRLSATALLKLKGTAGDLDDPDAPQRWKTWKGANPMKGHLVLLGGSYRAARDAYPTPVGYLDGVDILANTAQTRLPGFELRSEIPKTLVGIWFHIKAYMLLLALYFIPKPWRLVVTILAGPIYAFAGGWIWFFAGGTFQSFVPYLEGLVSQQIYEHFRAVHVIKRENRELKERLRELSEPATQWIALPDSSAPHSEP